jgi:hypothetical protein
VNARPNQEADSFQEQTLNMSSAVPEPAIHRWIKTDCGRAKYADLASRTGVIAKLRLVVFVLIAAIRDWRLP